MIDLRETTHFINLKRKNYFNGLLEQTGLNLIELDILVFLSEFPENNTFTEIMKSKDYAKSYVSKAITNLVNNGYLLKEGSLSNKKVYNLFLLEKGEPIILLYHQCLEEFRNKAFLGIKDEEQKIFENVIQQISNNLED
ncbi:MarR family winged helix-turn-helix transcriptional regulator [Tannockella kyphosi]|uniref:MarR family winged helix-turn-helix transcriptional regulator n=1 Tax=Tannockella kyphosi TaxID=2899121 RepID=UPI0020112CF8|nr:MarR family winged helix-turn-helix transcriptional regulator [Tannockella kyphosi]